MSYNPCALCPTNPLNGGSGACMCTLPNYFPTPNPYYFPNPSPYQHVIWPTVYVSPITYTNTPIEGEPLMKRTRIDPMDFPLIRGESWWVVHPNRGDCEFKVPSGAITVCIESFLCFLEGKVYSILSNDAHNGWVAVASKEEIIEMPHYVFARYFDAEAFVCGVLKDKSALDRAIPFDYKPTLPKQIEKFED